MYNQLCVYFGLPTVCSLREQLSSVRFDRVSGGGGGERVNINVILEENSTENLSQNDLSSLCTAWFDVLNH